MKHKNIRIVLVETSHPGNIGAVARAMKNMCLDQLSLVKPKTFPSPIATARASGATDILENATIFDSLGHAIADCGIVIGASARLRSVQWPQLNPRECAALTAREFVNSPVAIVFGREDSGLSNEELDRCQYLVHIPTNPDYQSLNVAAAVQVICYEVYLQLLEDKPEQQTTYMPASSEEMEGFFTHMEIALREIGFLKPPSCKKLLRRLRRVFNRAGLDKTDVNIVRGILSAAQGKKYAWDGKRARRNNQVK